MGYVVRLIFYLGFLLKNRGECVKVPSFASSRANVHLAARPDFFRACSDVKHSIDLRKASLDVYDRSAFVYVNAEGAILRDSTPFKKGVLAIFKCKHAADNNCEVENWRLGPELCTLMEMKNAMWSPMINAVHPRVHCPLKKGLYEMHNATIDLTKLQALPMELTKYYWRFRVSAFDHTLFSCVEAGGRLVWSKKM